MRGAFLMLARSSRRARNQPRREEVSVRSAPAGPDKGRIDHIAALVLCGLAALRIFFFSAAFPLCNNVDEDDHFDLVFKYSHGYLPRAASERYSPDSADLIALYWSPEYLNPLEAFPDRTYPPPWWQRRGVAESRESNRNLAAWRNMKDYQ